MIAQLRFTRFSITKCLSANPPYTIINTRPQVETFTSYLSGPFLSEFGYGASKICLDHWVSGLISPFPAQSSLTAIDYSCGEGGIGHALSCIFRTNGDLQNLLSCMKCTNFMVRIYRYIDVTSTRKTRSSREYRCPRVHV